MRLTPAEIAAALGAGVGVGAGAEILAEGSPEPPRRAVIASAAAGPGDLFFGLRGARRDGGEFAPEALAAGAWGAVVSRRARSTLGPVWSPNVDRTRSAGAWVFAVDDPLAALQALARAWRRALGEDLGAGASTSTSTRTSADAGANANAGARVVGVTGSVGKTSVKDIARALLPGRVHANRENLNTEIGLPLTVLEAPEDSDLLVLEMAMRGPGQIAELAAIAEPEVAVITNVGPVHLELLGSVAAIAAAKAEVIDFLPADGTLVAPVAAGELEPHLARAPRLLRFGPGGDVEARSRRVEAGVTEALVATPAGETTFHLPFAEAHNLTNALAAIAAGVALGADPGEMSDRAADIGFSRFRGERIELGDGILLVNDCYNANPVSMRAALDHLASLAAERRIAVLGEMAELGPGASRYHAEVGAHARAHGVDLLVGVGAPARDYEPDELVGSPAEAAELLAARLRSGDAVLVKGSRSAGLEAVAAALREML